MAVLDVHHVARVRSLALYTGQVTAVDLGPGVMTVRYLDGVTREIRFPPYASSAHSVSVTQPRKLFDDVSAWLEQP